MKISSKIEKKILEQKDLQFETGFEEIYDYYFEYSTISMKYKFRHKFRIWKKMAILFEINILVHIPIRV